MFGNDALPERFWDKVHPEPMSGCWLWTAGTDSSGYGSFYLDGHYLGAHRVAYRRLVREPGKLQIDHLCRTPLCVNPDHLEAVTQTENVRRGNAGLKNRSKTHCRNGHPYTEENIINPKPGERRCLTCHRKHAREAMRRLKARRKAGGQ